MTEEEFKEWLAKIPEEWLEPFCPFDSGCYCNTAYSIECYSCKWNTMINKETFHNERSK